MFLSNEHIQSKPSNMEFVKTYLWFMKRLQLTRLVFPTNIGSLHHIDNFQLCLYNPHMTILVIEPMSLGIIMTDHTANQFGYIRNLIEKGQHKMIRGSKLKVVRINNEWDISKWNQGKLERFYIELNSYLHQYQTLNALKAHIENQTWSAKNVDIDFLESLCWG